MTNEDTSPQKPKVLASLGSGERDTSLNAQPTPSQSHRRTTPKASPVEASQGDEVLKLPRGALVAMRKSGGLTFSVSEIYVYRNGRILRQSIGAGQPHAQRDLGLLGNEQMSELQSLLSASQFPRYAAPARQSSDTVVTEIVARMGRNVRFAEFASYATPEGLAALTDWLSKLSVPREM